MHELYDDLMELYGTLSKELTKCNEKLTKVNGNISASDIDYINKLTHAIKSIKTTVAMMDAEYSNGGDYEHYHDDNEGSYRGRGRNAKRDSMGRYSSERGYSRDNTIDGLHNLMEDTQDERTRQEIQRLINKMQSM